MKATKMISKITQFMDEDKEVFVYIYKRDKNGCVISTEVFPLESVFSHERGTVKLCIEDSQRNLINE